MKEGYVYFLTNWTNEVLYIGVTSNLEKRILEHRGKVCPGFTKKYNLKKLVYYEYSPAIQDAIAREKQLKNWARAKKDALVEKANPEWVDLFDGTCIRSLDYARDDRSLIVIPSVVEGSDSGMDREKARKAQK